MEEMGQTREPVRGLTFEDVWAAMMETDKKFKETDRQMRETDRQMKEMTEKTDRLLREIAEKSAREWEEIHRLTRETDKQFKETDRKMQETDRKIGELGNRFGELAEHLVTPNIAEKFRALNYSFTKAGPDVEFFDRNHKALTEVDVWLENGEFAMAVEVKSRPRKRDVEDHVKRMRILRAYLDERNDTRKLLGAIAGAIVTKELRDSILKQGFYVIEQSGDTVKIEPAADFQPRVW
jgi:hypothetical protein